VEEGEAAKLVAWAMGPVLDPASPPALKFRANLLLPLLLLLLPCSAAADLEGPALALAEEMAAAAAAAAAVAVAAAWGLLLLLWAAAAAVPASGVESPEAGSAAALPALPAMERSGPCTCDRMLLPPWASVWLSADAATPTKIFTGAAPKLSSWTVHLWRPEVKVALPTKSMAVDDRDAGGVGESPALGGAWNVMHVSSSASVTSGEGAMAAGWYQVNRGLGVVASCKEAAMPGCMVMKGYICREEMDAQGSDCCSTNVSLSRRLARMTGCLSSRGASSMDSTSEGSTGRPAGTDAVQVAYSGFREGLSTATLVAGLAGCSTAPPPLRAPWLPPPLPLLPLLPLPLSEGMVRGGGRTLPVLEVAAIVGCCCCCTCRSAVQARVEAKPHTNAGAPGPCGGAGRGMTSSMRNFMDTPPQYATNFMTSISSTPRSSRGLTLLSGPPRPAVPAGLATFWHSIWSC